MLVYHPLYDLYHGMYRALLILERHPEHRVQFDAYRILDFYLLFPHLVGEVSLPNKMLKMKRTLAQRKNKYNHVPSPETLVGQMIGSHRAITMSLAAKGLISSEALDKDWLQRTAQPLPAEVIRLFDAQQPDDDEVADFVAQQLGMLPVLGDNGLKAKSGLLEYRYDSK